MRPQNSSSLAADNQSNITIIDCRHTQLADPLKLFNASLQAANFAPVSEKPAERKSTFDQFKSSLGLGGERRRRPAAELQPEIPAGSVKILDIRRTKTNRKRPKQFQRLSNEYENVTPQQCQLARDEDDDDSDDVDGAGAVGDGLDEADGDAELAGQSMNQSGAQVQQADAIRNKKHQQEQQQRQQQEQQRQQSGETLSSFESDYDLLVYLGETETEDLIETERSLDYLDQTWRQSICGASSLAPTLDESLGELLQTPQLRSATTPRSPTEHNDEFEQLWTQQPSNTKQSRQQATALASGSSTLNNPNNRQRAPPAGNRLAATPNRGDHQAADLLSNLPYGWSASLPRQTSRLDCSPELAQTEVKSLGRRANNNVVESATSSLASIGDQANKQVASGAQNQVRSAGNLGNKLVSLFGRNLATASNKPTATAAATGTRQQQVPAGLSEREAETVRQLNEFLEQARLDPARMEAPQKPRRHQQVVATGAEAGAREPKRDENADELDRLLAEMSQSLDLDSLARYDPHSRQTRAPKGYPDSGDAFLSNKQRQARPAQNVVERGAKVAPIQARSEAILDEYDGASRILEQMINDQLDEARNSRRDTQRQQVAGKRTRQEDNERSRSSLSPKQANELPANSSNSEPVSNEERDSGSSQVRKISSTGSSTGTAETCVKPAATSVRALKSSESRESRRSSLSGFNRAPHLKQINKKLSTFSRSLDVSPEAPRQKRSAKTLTVAKNSTLPLSASGAPDEGDDEEEEEDEDEESRGIPPRPPAVDYHDFEGEPKIGTKDAITRDSSGLNSEHDNKRRALIQVEASELPSATSSDEEGPQRARRRPSWPERHKLAMSRVKQRTMSGVRSVREHFNRRTQDEPNEGETTNAKETAPSDGVRELRPEPPARSRSTGSSSGKSVSPAQKREIKGPPAFERADLVTASESPPRQSRLRTRRTAGATSKTESPEPPVEGGGRKSFGQQMRERLSRSKSRLSKFLRPLSLHRNSQAAPAGGDQPKEQQDEKRSSVPLFQPGDIARNEPQPTRDESSLERQLKADLFDGGTQVGTAKLRPERSPASSRGRSGDSETKSHGSGELSGLETVGKQREGLFDLALGRKSSARHRKSRPQQRRGTNQQDERPSPRRPASLISLRRFGETFARANSNKTDNAPRDEQDLDQQMAAAAAVAHRKRNKRSRNRSTGDTRASPLGAPEPVESVVPARATTDDYFGFKAPLKTSPIGSERVQRSLEVHQRVEMGPRIRPASAMMFDSERPEPAQSQPQQRFFARRNRRLPNRSQSLRGSDFERCEESGAKRSTEVAKSNGEKQGDGAQQQTKSVSFQNLAPPSSPFGPANQRRPLSPVSPNTFRPISASPGASGFANEDEPLELEPATTCRPAATGPITPIPLVSVVLANHSGGPTTVGSALPPKTTSSRSHTLLQDLRNKCSDLFDHRQQPQQQRPPVRPPRNKRRRAQGQTLPAARSKSLAPPPATPPHMIQVEPSSPSASLLTASESPELRREPGRAAGMSRRLTNFAIQLRTSAADFFAGGGGGGGGSQFKRQASDLGPASRRVAQTTTSAERRPHFWNLDEPLEQRDLAQWRPIIPVGDHSKASPGSNRKHKHAKTSRSSSFRLPKDEATDNADHLQSEALAASKGKGHEGAALEGEHPDEAAYDSDSTWDSSCSEDEDRCQRRAGAQANDPAGSVHDDESPQGKQQVGSSLNRGGADSRRQLVDHDRDREQINADSQPPSSSNRRHDKNKDRDRNNNNNNRNDNRNRNDVTEAENVLASSHKNWKQLQPEANKVPVSDANLEEVVRASGSLSESRDDPLRRQSSNENETKDGGNLSPSSERDSRGKFTRPQAIGLVNERAFKFNESLPSPSQILSEIKRESGAGGGKQPQRGLAEMTATRGARRIQAQAEDSKGVPGAKSSSLDSNQVEVLQAEENANRLSVYDNVSPQEARVWAHRDSNRAPTSQTKGDKPEPAAEPQPLTSRPSPMLSPPSATNLGAALRDVDDAEEDEDDSQQDEWAVEPVAESTPKRISSRPKTKSPSHVEATQEIKTFLRSQRDLVPTSGGNIGGEPEDEPKRLPTSRKLSEQKDDLLRRQSSFSLTNGVSDEDETESSLLLGNSRLRLERRLALQREQLAKHTKPPVPSRPPNLPRARESLVKRMAKNFDQTARDHQQPVVRGPQFGPAATAAAAAAGVRRVHAVATAAAALPELADEPKSDSTWYDAKSVELLDEAEVAELLREFESEGNEDANSNNDEDDNSDQFVTLSQDQPGRRDSRRRERANEHDDDEDDDDDATLNDDETLNDADDADDPFETNNQDEEESIYVSAATGTTNENLSPAAVVVPVGSRVGRLVEEFQRQQQQQQQASARSEAVGRLGAVGERRETFERSLLEGRADRRHCSSGAANGDHDDDDQPCGGVESAATSDERKSCGSKREQRVDSQTISNAGTKQRTNATADQNLTPLATTRPVDPDPESARHTTAAEANTILMTTTPSHPKSSQTKLIADQPGSFGERHDDNDQPPQDEPSLFAAEGANTCEDLELVQGSSQDDDGDDDGRKEEDGDDSNGAQTSADLSSGHSSGGCHEDLISLSSSSLSSESMPELRQRKNLQRLYNIVNEICSSEETFLATLKLLNEDFKRFIIKSLPSSPAPTEPISHADTLILLQQQPPFDCIALIMKHLPQLQTLNQSLLDELRQARNQWPSTQKISHVLVKIGPFLKHYSSYIRDFECIQQQFQENLKKSQQFRDTIRRFECEHADKFNQLSIQHHLLKPIQRIPQYRLLLQQYLHHLKPDDADYEDTVEALEVVSRVAEHANQSLSEGANFARLLSLQAKIVAGKQRDLIQPGRLFLKEGELMKVCRKQIQPRWFVLLSDALLYLKAIQLNDILYLKYELPLEDCQVELPRVGGVRECGAQEQHEPIDKDRGITDQERAGECELNICTTVRSMTLIARSRQERDDWFQALSSAIEQHRAKRRSFRAGQRERRQGSAEMEEPFEGLIGRKAPIWIPDSRVSRCQLCTSNFSALFRRHHCRACGRVVCSACSSNKAPLIYLKCRAARVCDQCFESLRANMHLYYLPACQIDERELRRLDEHFKILLKSQFVKRRVLASKDPKVVPAKAAAAKVANAANTAADCATSAERP